MGSSGPLADVRVLEIGGIGPGPFAGVMLADMGADVIRVDRPGAVGRRELDDLSHQVLGRGRRSVAVDLKNPRGRDLVLDLAARSDVLLEGFRPGVAERLGLGPADALGRNPKLVYGRMTGWGQDGPYARRAGHDINYVAVTGALEPIVGAGGRPTAPLNMLGDFGGGGMLMAFGVVSALLHARRTGEGQVVDAAIVDGTALFTAMLHSMRAAGQWSGGRGENLFDGGAPYYGVYRTADDRWISVGAIEPKFYRELLRGLGLDGELAAEDQNDHASWPRTRARFAERFRERTRDEWTAVLSRVVPDERKAGTPLYLMLDDLSGASLIAPFALTRWQPESAGDDQPAEGTCVGFKPGSSALLPAHIAKRSDRTRPVEPLPRPGDPAGWHDLEEITEPSTRRARRIDVTLGDVIGVDAMFQDSATVPSGGRVAVHEYRLEATADPRTGALLGVRAEPRILPYDECPLAVLNLDRLLGTPLEDLRTVVPRSLRGTAGCTHLNDALRALAEVPALVAALRSYTA